MLIFKNFRLVIEITLETGLQCYLNISVTILHRMLSLQIFGTRQKSFSENYFNFIICSTFIIPSSSQLILQPYNARLGLCLLFLFVNKDYARQMFQNHDSLPIFQSFKFLNFQFKTSKQVLAKSWSKNGIDYC